LASLLASRLVLVDWLSEWVISKIPSCATAWTWPAIFSFYNCKLLKTCMQDISLKQFQVFPLFAVFSSPFTPLLLRAFGLPCTLSAWQRTFQVFCSLVASAEDSAQCPYVTWHNT